MRTKQNSEAASRDVLKEKVFLEISQNSQENTCAVVSFSIKLQALFLLKKRLWHRCVPVYFAKFQEHLFFKTPLVVAFGVKQNSIIYVQKTTVTAYEIVSLATKWKTTWLYEREINIMILFTKMQDQNKSIKILRNTKWNYLVAPWGNEKCAWLPQIKPVKPFFE